jgi:DNA-binding NtrC family response regulator
VRLPPLRERLGDLPVLASAILAALAGSDGPYTLTDEAAALLGRHSWPGNVRELRNVLVRAAANAEGRSIDGTAVRHALDGDGLLAQLDAEGGPDPAALVAAHRGNVTAAARAAGMARSTFRDRLGQATGREGARP